MGQFDENSELEKVIKALKKRDISLNDITEKIGYTRARLNNIRRFNNSVQKDEVIAIIKANYPNVDFNESSVVANDQMYYEKYVHSLEQEVIRLRNQIDLLIKKLLDGH